MYSGKVVFKIYFRGKGETVKEKLAAISSR
jgi:hypothetical protein